MKLGLKDLPKKYTPNPMLKGIPDALKEPKAFRRTEKKIARMMEADHTHKTVKAFTTCAWCQDKFKKKHEYIKKLGFASYNQYVEYRRIMTIIINKGFQL